LSFKVNFDVSWLLRKANFEALVSLDAGVTWFYLVSLGFTWCLVSLGFTWHHSVSLGVTLASLGVTQFHLVSLGFTLVSLSLTWCHSVSPKPGTRGFSGSFPHDSGSLGCALPVGQSIFSPLEGKKTAWLYLDIFFQKTGIPATFWKTMDSVLLGVMLGFLGIRKIFKLVHFSNLVLIGFTQS
jgi:hypothetical protein